MQDDEKITKRRLRHIIEIIVIIIIILLLITCCTSKYWGRIGSIDNDGSVTIDDDTDDLEIILNKELQFYNEKYTMSLSDEDLKLSFFYQKINPKEITCYTADPSIATCYVDRNYVVVLPKKKGSVNVFVEALTNGKRYLGKAKLTITAATKYIKLSKNKVAIDLNTTDMVQVPFSLVGFRGTPKVSVSDANIVKAEVKDGVLTIWGLKDGDSTVTIKVSANGQTYQAKVYVQVLAVKQNSNSSLKDLKVSVGDLHFQKDKTKYTLEVENQVTKFSVTESLASNKAHVKYYYNGEEVKDLKDLELKVGANKVVIEVEAEDGTRTTYEITINRAQAKNEEPQESNRYLKDIESNIPLKEEFSKEKNHYSLDVPYQKELHLKGITENKDSKVTYKLNGEEITSDSLNDKLRRGENKLEIVVENSDGSTTTYTVDIFKRYRVVELAGDDFVCDITGSCTIGYMVYEYTSKNKRVEVQDTVAVNIPGFEGDINVTPGGINIEANRAMNGVTTTLEVTIDGSRDQANLKFEEKSYYLRPDTKKYNIYTEDGKGNGSIVLNNNIFSTSPRVENKGNQICLYDVTDPEIYVCLTGEENLSFGNVAGSNSLALDFTVSQAGNYNIHVEASVPGVTAFDLTIEATEKHVLILDPNGGFLVDSKGYAYDSPLEFALADGEVFDLSTYQTGYYVDQENCWYYHLISFNENKTGDGKSYGLTDKVTVKQNMTLYANYSKEDKSEEVEIKKRLYFVFDPETKDEDTIFYSQEYGKKMLYPGLKGSYALTINNAQVDTLEITGMMLEEESVCIDSGCLNMAYEIDGYADKFILNKENPKEITFAEPLVIGKNDNKTINLKWEWQEINDALDTALGNAAAEKELDYYLTISLDFIIKDKSCKIDGVQP